MNYHATPAVTAVPGSNQTLTECLPKWNFISVLATRQFCDDTNAICKSLLFCSNTLVM